MVFQDSVSVNRPRSTGTTRRPQISLPTVAAFHLRKPTW